MGKEGHRSAVVPSRPLAASPPGRLPSNAQQIAPTCVRDLSVHCTLVIPFLAPGRCGRTAALGSLPMAASASTTGAASGTDAMLFFLIPRFHSCFDSLVPGYRSVRDISVFFPLSLRSCFTLPRPENDRVHYLGGMCLVVWSHSEFFYLTSLTVKTCERLVESARRALLAEPTRCQILGITIPVEGKREEKKGVGFTEEEMRN